MYQIPPHRSPAIVGHIAALATAAVILMFLALALPVERVGGDPIQQPLQAPAGLDL